MCRNRIRHLTAVRDRGVALFAAAAVLAGGGGLLVEALSLDDPRARHGVDVANRQWGSPPAKPKP